MKIELSEQQINTLLQVLGEVPAKVSYTLLQTISEQVAAENRLRLSTAQMQVTPANAASLQPNG